MYIILNTYKYVNCVCVCEWVCVYVFMTHDYEFQKKLLDTWRITFAAKLKRVSKCRADPSILFY